MGLRETWAGWSRWQRCAAIGAAAVSVYAIVGFTVAPVIARSQGEHILRDTLGREVRIGQVRIHPFWLSVEVGELSIPNRSGGTFASIGLLFVDFELSSLWHRVYTFREIRLVEPFVELEVLPDGSLAFADLIEALSSPDDEPEGAVPSGAPPALLARSVVIEAGEIALLDRSRPTDFEHRIVPIELRLSDFGTRPDDESPYRFSAATGADEQLEWEGRLSVVPLYSSGRIVLKGLKPRTGWRYVQDDVLFEIASGSLDIELEYEVDARDAVRATLPSGAIRLRDFQIADREFGEVPVAVPELDLLGIEGAYPEQSVRIGRIAAQQATLRMRRLEDGGLRIVQLFQGQAASEQEPGPADPTADPTASPTASPAGRPSATVLPEPAADASRPWSVVIEEVALSRTRLEFEDHAIPDCPAGARRDRHRAQRGVDRPRGVGRRGARHRAGARRPALPARQGRAGLAGGVARARDRGPRAATVRAVLDAIAGARSVPRATGPAGRIAGEAEGARRTAARLPRKCADRRLPQPRLPALERAVVVHRTRTRGHRCHAGADRTDARPPPLAGSGAQLRDRAGWDQQPRDVDSSIGGRVQPKTPAAPNVVPVSVGVIALSGARARFEDRSVEPSFATELTQFAGTIEGLSSQPGSKASVALEGKLDAATPLTIAGSLSPLTPGTALDLKLGLRNFGLPSLTPYSGRYVGQTIARGKLFLDLHYQLEGSTLAGENKVFLDQFTLGDTVESEQAVDLPVSLAVALAKDRKGEIRLDLPIRGEVDDPEFSLLGIVLDALRNLITRIALSPFSALGDLAGFDGEELRTVGFAAGASTLVAQEQAKLDALAGALAERPALALEITGAANSALDGAALQQAALDLELRRRRYRELQASVFAGAPESLDEVVLEPEQRLELLEREFEQRFGAKAEPEPPPPSRTPPSEQAALEQRIAMLSRRVAGAYPVESSELRELARQRASAIHEYLSQTGGVPAERLHVLEVALDADGADDPDVGGAAVHARLALAPR